MPPVRDVVVCAVLGTLVSLAPHLVAGQAAPRDVVARREHPEVLSVRFVGVRHVEKADLASALATRASHCKSILLEPFCLITKSHFFYEHDYLDRDELRRDVLRILIFYYKHGYRDAAVDTSLTPRYGPTARVTFTVTEGPLTTISKIAITPDSIFSRRVRNRLQLPRPGDPLDLFKLGAVIDAMHTELWREAYADAHIDTATTLGVANGPKGPHPTADLAFTIRPGKKAIVGAVNVTGTQKISEETVRRSLTFEPGKPFIRSDVNNNQRTLYQSGLFRSGSITVTNDSVRGDSVKDIDVNVAEAPLHQVQLRTGFSTVEFLQATGSMTFYNWLGGGRKLTFTAGAANILAQQLNGKAIFQNVVKDASDQGFATTPFLQPEWQGAIDLTQPWFLAPENSLGAGVFARRRSAPGVYVETAYGANATFTRAFFDNALPVSLRYQYEQTSVQAGQIYYCVNYGACDIPTINALSGTHRLSPLVLTASIDRSNGLLYPTEGWTARAELQHASNITLSQFHYDRAYIEGTWYQTIAHINPTTLGTAVLALHAEAGWVRPLTTHPFPDTTISDVLYPSVRFYAGGASSVRGFGENELGPRVLTISPDSLRQRTVAITAHHDTTLTFCPASTPIQNCNPNQVEYFKNAKGRLQGVPISDANFVPRPLGGNQLLEGTAEFRFPIKGNLGAAVFADGAIVGTGTGFGGEPIGAAGAITPGIGIRYYSSVGAIRIDIGFNPITTYNLVVITQQGAGASASLVKVNQTRIYAPALTEGGLAGLLNRINLNLSIGQAF
jgi:outer membrane protein insertion porin family